MSLTLAAKDGVDLQWWQRLDEPQTRALAAELFASTCARNIEAAPTPALRAAALEQERQLAKIHDVEPDPLRMARLSKTSHKHLVAMALAQVQAIAPHINKALTLEACRAQVGGLLGQLSPEERQAFAKASAPQVAAP